MAEARKVGRPGRSEAEQDAFRARIVAIARDLFANEGFESVSMRKIAARAGCSAMALYYYFRNKREILQHIWDEVFLDLHARLVECAGRHDDPVERLKSICNAFLRYWLDNRQSFSLIYLNMHPEAMTLGHDVYNLQNSAVRSIYELFEAVIADCVAAGRLSGAPATAMAQVLFTSIYGLLFCRMTIPEFDWLPEPDLADQVIAGFLRGFAGERR